MRATALVAALLEQLATCPLPYGTFPASEHPDDSPTPNPLDDPLATAHNLASLASLELDTTLPRVSSRRPHSETNMDYKIDFGDTTGVQTRGKKAAKKAAKAAQQAKWFESDNEGEGNAAGDGGGDDAGGTGGGDNSGAGGNGGDDNNGGGGDDDWDFGGSKKNKKKQKKKEEEEEEQRRKDAESANANKGADPLSWADEANEAAADDDWAGFTTKKDKKGKKGKKVRQCNPYHHITLHYLTSIGRRGYDQSTGDISFSRHQPRRFSAQARVLFWQ